VTKEALQMTTENDDLIGYKKPPKKHRFKKGQSGNPSGRPKGRARLSETFLSILEERIPVTAGGRKQYMCRAEAFANQIVKGAANGDAQMTRFLFDLLAQYDSENFSPVTEIRLTELETQVC